MDSVPAYSYGQTREMLSALPEQLQEAFVVYCSARMLPLYDAFARRMKVKDAGALRQIVDRLWTLIVDGEIAEEETKQMAETLDHLDLGKEGCCDEREDAVDAAGAVLNTFEWCCFTSSTHPAFAVEAIRNAVYQRLNEELFSSQNSPDGSAEDEVFDHPAMKMAMHDIMEVLVFLKDREELVEGDVIHLRMLAEKRLLPER